ncbi:hypothetical protein SLEP1_g49467 [Rubroshorea leprosula]|uniref:Uncharacterized protein n=1 Tax=Rubroshorea leprosula TaxID=152421 RepID=A0AAV5LWW1_9ROSI|nr:hypothetical protein SLEP1_g49467 [Rubroshorea leprosula]
MRPKLTLQNSQESWCAVLLHVRQRQGFFFFFLFEVWAILLKNRTRRRADCRTRAQQFVGSGVGGCRLRCSKGGAATCRLGAGKCRQQGAQAVDSGDEREKAEGPL